MSIDVSSILSEMSEAAIESLGSKGSSMINKFSSVFDQRHDSLKELLEAYSEGDISQEDFKFELEKEKNIIEAELITLEIEGKSAIQKAVNSAMSKLTDTALNVI